MKKKDIFFTLLAFILVFTGFTSSKQLSLHHESENQKMTFTNYSVVIRSQTAENDRINIICTITNTSNHTPTDDETVMTLFASQDGRRLERISNGQSLDIEKLKRLRPGESENIKFSYDLQETSEPVEVRFIAYDGYCHTTTVNP